jgi:recombination protein RecA
MYGKGIYRLGEVIDLGVQLGLVDKAGAWYSYKGDRIGQGKKNACEFLQENTTMANEIEGLIRTQLLDSGTAKDDADSDSEEDNVTPISGGQ